MVLGLAPYTAFHVLISLIGIVSGCAILFGMRNARPMNGWTGVYLATTLATSVTGFFFPFHGFTPALAVGILSMAILAAAIAARYRYHLAGSWRWIYVVSATSALYLNVFVLVVQSFLKIPALHRLAPNGSEPPFAVAQGLVLLFFVLFGYRAVKGFHPPVRTSPVAL